MQSQNNGIQSNINMDIPIQKLKKLDQNERVIVGLFYYELLTVEEIAMIMQTSLEFVQSKLDNVFTRISNHSSEESQINSVTSGFLG